MSTLRIAVDLMGGDGAPSVVIKGVKTYLEDHPDEQIVVVGDHNVGQELIGAVKFRTSTGRVTDDAQPTKALESNPRCSILEAMRALQQGEQTGVEAVVSMGPTGASLAAAVLTLGSFEGIRPCIGGPFLQLAPHTIFVDLGSNVDCRPRLLVDFAAMGCVLAREFFGIQDPRVALLSVGTEPSKGNRQVKKAHSLFKASKLNFVGNVEPYDFFRDTAPNVIVCDGFVGNILLKFTEVLEKALTIPLINPQAKGGGPILGVNGVVVVGHGASGPEEVAMAIATARQCIQLNLVEKLKVGIAALPSPYLYTLPC